MMNNQHIGIQDQGFRCLGSFPIEMPCSKGISLQLPVLLAMEGGSTGQSLRNHPVFWDITSSHFSSATERCLNFPDQFKHRDHSIPSWSQASEIDSSVYSNHRPLEVADSADKKYVTFRSRDTLQSLVQSCPCSSQNTQSYEENFRCRIPNVPEERRVEFQRNQPAVNNDSDWRQYHHMSFQQNLQVENYSFKSQILDLLPSKFRLENQAIDYSHGLISPASSSISETAAMAKRNRIRWTEELHNLFIDCVNRLGGAKKATPKGILKLMNCDGLTILHIKSHLQKYRVAQHITESKEEKRGTSSIPELDPEMGMQIVEALKTQIDVQRSLYEQLECQKNLQSRIEEQAQQLRKMFHSQVEKPMEDPNY